MIRILNKLISVECEASGRNLSLRDIERGQQWNLDEASLVYSTADVRSPWIGMLPVEPLVPQSARSVGSAELEVLYGAGSVPVAVRYRLENDHVVVLLPKKIDTSVTMVSLPGSFIPAEGKVKFTIPIMQGFLWDGKGKPFQWMRGEGSHQGFSMPFLGYLGERGGLLATAETRDDCRWWFGKDESGRCWATNLQASSTGSFRYDREVRLYPVEPDIVAVAKRYRNRVIERGEFITWAEKIAKRPQLERLFGALIAYIGYCKDDVDYLEGCKKLKAYGFDHAFLYPGRFNIYYKDIHMGGVPAIDLPKETVRAITKMGYDMAPWSWVMEALDDGTKEVHHSYRLAPDGKPIANWKIDDQQWYLTCHSEIPKWQERALKEDIDDMSWDHFDVMSCMPPGECYALDHEGHLGHPATRSEDREAIKRTFRVNQAAGRMNSSENFNDAYLKELDFGSVKAFPQFGPWPFWPIPLTMLCYHDSMAHVWYELHSYNNGWRGRTTANEDLFEYGGGRPQSMAALDALMGCPPDVFPFGAQYGYRGHGHETFLYKYRFEDPEVQIALKYALPVARLHKRIGKLEMVDFQILSEDGYVQKSVFEDGTTIIANFSADFVGELGGIDVKVVPGVGPNPVPPYGWIEWSKPE